MQIRVEELPKGGQTVALDEPGQRAAVARALEGEVRTLEGKLHVERKGGDVEVRAQGRAVVDRPCDRCAESTDLEVSVDEVLTYSPVPTHTRHDEVGLSEEDLDVGYYKDGVIETEDVVSEAFALAAPLHVVCGRDACRDPRDLADRDDGGAGGHPAFQALKKLL